MSLVINANIICKKCSKQSVNKLYASVNATVNKPLKKEIIKGSFFEWNCPCCGNKSVLIYPMLYHDVKKKYMIYLIPNKKRRYFDDVAIEEQYKGVDEINKRAVSSIAELQEKINILAQGLDDRIIEIAKHALVQSISNEYKTDNIKGYFNMLSREQNRISFVFYIGENKVPYNKSTKAELYDTSARVLHTVYGNNKLTKGFHTVDKQWAKETIEVYRNMK